MTALDRRSRRRFDQLTEARTQLLSQTRRADADAGPARVLQGKQRALSATRRLTRSAGYRGAPEIGAGGGALPALGPGGGVGIVSQASSRDVHGRQEEMRREIARQMHDGPAQSIANIALQAQVVEP
jgi:signal transduction histidine kinase